MFKKQRRLKIISITFLLLAVSAAICVKLILSPEVIQRRLKAALKKYMDAEATMETCTFNPFKGIEMGGVRIYGRRLGRKEPLFEAEEILLKHQFKSLFSGKLRIEKVELVSPRLFVEISTADGKRTDTISRILEKIKAAAEGKKPFKIPAAQVIDASISVENIYADGVREDYTLNDINLTLEPNKDGKRTSYIRGAVKDRVFGNWRIAGVFDPSARRLRCSASAEDLALSTEVYERLPRRGKKIWRRINPSGRAAMDVDFTFDASGDKKMDFKVVMNLKDFSLTFQKFPYRLANLEGRLEFSEDSTLCRDFEGVMGPLKVTGEGAFYGYGEGSGMDLLVRAENLPLDEKLKSALDAEGRAVWDALHLSGNVNAEVRIVRKRGPGEKRHRYIKVEPLGCQATYDEFSYTLKNIRGHLNLNDRYVSIEKLVSEWGDSSVKIRGHIENISSQSGLNLSIEAKNIPLDDTLRNALSESYRAAWDSFRPSGNVNVFAAIYGDEGAGKKIHKTIEVECIGDVITYEKFPYALENVTGRLLFKDSTLYLNNISAAAAGGKRNVQIKGLIEDVAGDMGVKLDISGKGISFDKNLKNALSRENQELWDSFKLEGIFDFTCRLDKEGDEPLGMALSINSEDSSIHYDKFPLKVTGITGKVEFDQGIVKIYGVQGKHKSAGITVNGQIDSLSPDAGVELQIKAAGLHLDNDLKSAIPAGLQKLWNMFRPEGVVDLSADIFYMRDEDKSLRMDFTADVSYTRAGATCGVVVKNMTGESKLAGTVRGAELEFEGESAISQLQVENRTISGVRNVFQKRGDILSIYGITGEIYGGVIEGAAKVDLSGDISYGCVTDIKNIKLESVLADVFHYSNDDLRGNVSGKVFLQGNGTEPGNLVSRGEIRLSEASLWEIPMIFQILSLLQLSLPERSAFDEALVKYYLLEKEAYIEEVDLKGKALSIYGEGTMGFDGNLDFSFLAGIGKRRFPRIPLISKLVRSIQKQMVQLKVNGTFAKPDTRIEAVRPVTQRIKGIFRMLHPDSPGK